MNTYEHYVKNKQQQQQHQPAQQHQLNSWAVVDHTSIILCSKIDSYFL